MVGAVCLLLSSTVYAEDLKSTDANIVGHVIEKSTREHLPYMTVSLKGTTIGTMTDATGHYFLKNLPEGEFTLSVSAVGYKSQERKVVLKRGKTLEENFELEEDMVALDGVVVTANRNETARRLAPTWSKWSLLNCLSRQTRILCRKDWPFSQVCGWRPIARIAVIHKCASTGWMGNIPKY